MLNLRCLRKVLSGYKNDVYSNNIFKYHRECYYRSYLSVQIFYAVTIYLIIIHFYKWDQFLRIRDFSPLWPVIWIEFLDIKTGVNIVFTIMLIASLVSLFKVYHRIARAFFFITLILFVALINSMGIIGHGWHAVLAFGFLFIFLPDGKMDYLAKSRISMQSYMLVFFGAQILFMTFYTLSGVWKIYYGVEQLLEGKINNFSPSALPLHISNRLLKINSPSILGDFVIEHQFLAWQMYLATLYIEFFSVIAIFRRTLHRFWGISLILMHIGIYLTMKIAFVSNVLFLAVYIANSPFIPTKYSVRDVFKNLPIISLLYLFKNKLQKNSRN